MKSHSRPELVFWVPPQLRCNIQTFDMHVAGPHVPLQLDFSKFEGGERWAEGMGVFAPVTNTIEET